MNKFTFNVLILANILLGFAHGYNALTTHNNLYFGLSTFWIIVHTYCVFNLFNSRKEFTEVTDGK